MIRSLVEIAEEVEREASMDGDPNRGLRLGALAMELRRIEIGRAMAEEARLNAEHERKWGTP